MPSSIKKSLGALHTAQTSSKRAQTSSRSSPIGYSARVFLVVCFKLVTSCHGRRTHGQALFEHTTCCALLLGLCSSSTGLPQCRQVSVLALRSYSSLVTVTHPFTVWHSPNVPEP